MSPCLVALTMLVAGCSPQAPKGQVIATVNGQEITPQDLQAEARSSTALAGANASVLLQRVVARALLAQAAHTKGMDRDPGYPSDIARLKQDFIAQKLLRASLKPPAAPTAADLAKVMADNPYDFARRESITVDDISAQGPASSLDSLQSLKYANDIMARLSQLSIPHNRRTLSLDTAKLPAPLAAKLSAAPIGQMFFVRNGNEISAITPTAQSPVTVPPEDAAAAATQIFQGAAVQQQIAALVAQLRSQAKIVYTNGFTPAAKGDAATTQPPAASVVNSTN